jgi:uncharacterized damage-inducible protein DinB
MIGSERRLQSLVSDHALAVREFSDRASALDGGRWTTPRAEGKWTPAQETKHVLLAYDEFLRQLVEDRPMRRRGNVVRRWIARLIGLPSILWFKRIPVAVNAPREVRPEWIDTPAAELVPQLRRRAAEFDAAFERTWRENPRRRMSHYLFGTLSLAQGIRLVAVHTRHHAAFLPDPGTSQ